MHVTYSVVVMTEVVIKKWIVLGAQTCRPRIAFR